MTHFVKTARGMGRALLAGAISGLGTTVAVHAQEQPATPAGGTLETVVVTGSMIKRTDFETPSPIQVLTSDDLRQSGYTNVSEVLRGLAANGQGTLSQTFNGAFAGGASGIALRGLTVGATLTLIDGERMIPYPLSDDAERNFVDVSTIPFLAVDRIDVLKDSASAAYGSDAIAGVVNVILKRAYTGVQSSLEGGTTSHHDGTTEHASVIGGVGELASDGYNAYLALEYRHQDNILSMNRTGVWNTRDWTPYGGFNNLRGAGTTNPNDAPLSAPVGGILVNPAVGGIDPTSVFLGSCNYARFIANQCTFYPPRYEVQPQTGNLNLLGRYTKAFSGDWQLATTATMFRSEAEQIGRYEAVDTTPFQNIAYAPGYAGPLLVPPNGVLFTVPANYPGNTFNQPTQIIIPPVDIGQETTEFATNTYRLFVELTGKAAGWDLDLTGGLMYASLTQRNTGLINGQALQNALNNGYVFGSGSSTAAWAPVAEITDTNKLQVADAHAYRTLTQLPGGALAIAVAAGFYHLTKNSPAPPAVANGAQFGNNAFALGSENDANAYLELSAPLIRGLELDIAGRWDHFNSYGSSTTPKLGLRYTPFHVLTLRGTYGKGFRAPNPAEAGATGAAFSGFQSTDPVLCPSGTGTAVGDFPSQCTIFPTGLQVAGKGLQPEKSTNYTFGVILKPLEPLTLAVDYWDIKVNQDVQSGVNAFFLGADATLFPTVRGPAQVLPKVTSIGPGGVPVLTNTPTPVGPYAYQLFPYINFSQTHVNGVDLDIAAHLNLGGAGRLAGSLNYTRIIHYLFGFGSSFFELAGTHGPEIVSGDTGNPKNRATASLGWDRGPANLTLSATYIGSFNITDPSIGINTCNDGLNSNFFRFPGQPVGLGNWCNVEHFTTFDLYGHYEITKNFRVHGSVLNLFGKQPPLDIQTYGAPNAAAYDPAMHQAGAVGRFFNIGGTYTF